MPVYVVKLFNGDLKTADGGFIINYPGTLFAMATKLAGKPKRKPARKKRRTK